MIVFAQWPQDSTGRLYVCARSGGEQGWIGYLLPPGAAPADNPIGLQDALTKSNGSFLFSAWDPPLATAAETASFLQSVAPRVPAAPNRGLLWLANPQPDQINGDTAWALPIDAAGKVTIAGFTAPLVRSGGMLNFSLAGGIKLGLSQDGGSIILTAGNPVRIKFAGQMAPVCRPILSAELPFAGPQRGCITLTNAFIQRRSLASGDAMRTGFQFVYPNTNKDQSQKQLSGWYPMLDLEQKLNDSIGFNVSLDITDPENRSCDSAEGSPKRSSFAFTGSNFDKQPTVLYTNYMTRSGYPIAMKPIAAAAGSGERTGALVLHAGPSDGPVASAFVFSPDGDFALAAPGTGDGGTAELLCGLSGTEAIRFTQGDRIRFVSGQPAYAASYPFQTASTVGPPVNASGNVLKPDFRSSWATIVPAPQSAAEGSRNFYLAQPQGATLYGKEAMNGTFEGLLFGFEDTSVRMAADSPAFPLVPYGSVSEQGEGCFKSENYQAFESQVVAPARRYWLQTDPSAPALLADADPSGAYQAATPAGLLLKRNGDKYTDVLLAHPPEGTDMRFVQLTPELQQALQTNQLFMVAANAKYLGQSGGGEQAGDPGFYNRLGIGGWELSADVGQRNRYADYSNVLIIKGRRGQSLAELAKHPEAWTQAAELAAPSDLRDKQDGTTEIGEPDPGEIVVLAQWMQAYIEQAIAQTDPFFARFQRIASDPDWTGIVVLRASVNQFPAELKGLQGGLDGGQLYAHHIGIDITPVNKDLSLTNPSSLFGLIYYVNPAFRPDQPDAPVAPDPGDYDFKLLTLKVLFDHAAVQDFRSLAQLTINRLFNQPVTGMGDPSNVFNSILLQGSYQHHDGKSYYVLDTYGDNVFKFTSNLLNKIEIVKAQFNTIGSEGSKSGQQTVSRFDLWGYIDFKPITQAASDGTAIPFDLFSFGSPTEGDAARHGLYFAGMAISMAYPQDKPLNRSFTFETENMSFDVSLSTPRPTSLYQAFPMEIQEAWNGDDGKKPAELGYLPVGAGANLTGAGEKWFGLRYRLNLGTAGELAGKLGLNAYLLLAWSADDGTDPANYKAAVGLQLPGSGESAKTFSLQGVLKLAIGSILLRYDTKAGAFVLSFTEIALKFLGLLKLPPNGATSLSLFGDPKAKDKGSSLGWYAIYKQPVPSEKMNESINRAETEDR